MYLHPDHPGSSERIAADYLAREVGPARRILGLGRGSTAILVDLEARGRRCVQVQLRREGHAAVARSGVPGTRVCGLAEALPFPERTFDAAVCLEGSDPVGCAAADLEEILRVLRPGGVLVLGFPNAFAPILWDPLRTVGWALAWLAGGHLTPPRGPAGARDHRSTGRALEAMGMRALGFRAVGYGPLRFAGRRLTRGGSASTLSTALASLLRLPGLSALAPWVCERGVWAWQRPHIDGTAVAWTARDHRPGAVMGG